MELHSHRTQLRPTSCSCLREAFKIISPIMTCTHLPEDSNNSRILRPQGHLPDIFISRSGLQTPEPIKYTQCNRAVWHVRGWASNLIQGNKHHTMGLLKVQHGCAIKSHTINCFWAHTSPQAHNRLLGERSVGRAAGGNEM